MSRKLHSGVSDQSKAAVHRLDDAYSLFNNAHWRGAMYVGGYAVECALKVALMKKFGCQNLIQLEQELKRRGKLRSEASIFIHPFYPLLKLTDSIDRLRGDQKLWRMFSTVNEWAPVWRYSPDESNRDEAEDFLNGVRTIKHWIETNN